MFSSEFQRAFFGIYISPNAKAPEIRDTIYEQVKSKKYLQI